ncbi:MAG: hypothetical protein BWY44_00782 [Candidatus Omnitrophica bacterium ADurb.Bin292]|nr:MAG: hypothetical protein BWY44_00782 [Candidatus Omnitrophica bacterium ADurb.Bin292]
MVRGIKHGGLHKKGIPRIPEDHRHVRRRLVMRVNDVRPDIVLRHKFNGGFGKIGALIKIVRLITFLEKRGEFLMPCRKPLKQKDSKPVVFNFESFPGLNTFGRFILECPGRNGHDTPEIDVTVIRDDHVYIDPRIFSFHRQRQFTDHIRQTALFHERRHFPSDVHHALKRPYHVSFSGSKSRFRALGNTSAINAPRPKINCHNISFKKRLSPKCGRFKPQVQTLNIHHRRNLFIVRHHRRMRSQTAFLSKHDEAFSGKLLQLPVGINDIR